MSLELPYPPSSNRYWRVWRGRAVKSTEARQYQTAVRLLSKKSFTRPLAGPLRVEIDVYRPARRGDLDNTLKVILDALNGVAFSDDSQVVELYARRFEDKAHPRAVVSVAEVSS